MVFFDERITRKEVFENEKYDNGNFLLKFTGADTLRIRLIFICFYFIFRYNREVL